MSEFSRSHAAGLGFFLAAWLSLAALAIGELRVINGDFSDLNGLAPQGDGWYAGVPTGVDQ